MGRGPCTQQDFQARPPLASGPHGLAWVLLGAELTCSRRPCDKQGSLTAPDLGIKEGRGGPWLLAGVRSRGPPRTHTYSNNCPGAGLGGGAQGRSHGRGQPSRHSHSQPPALEAFESTEMSALPHFTDLTLGLGGDRKAPGSACASPEQRRDPLTRHHPANRKHRAGSQQLGTEPGSFIYTVKVTSRFLRD